MKHILFFTLYGCTLFTTVLGLLCTDCESFPGTRKYCDYMKGLCRNCPFGFSGDSCLESCPKDSWKLDARCVPCPPNCVPRESDGRWCTRSNKGNCYACAPGWTGITCQKKCRDTWSTGVENIRQACSTQCPTSCFNQAIPAFSTSSCSNSTFATYSYCDGDWKLASSTRELVEDHTVCTDVNKYGVRCAQTCPEHCRAGKFYPRKCQYVTGVCTSCEPGYTGPHCESICLDVDKYGAGCAKSCPVHCRDSQSNPRRCHNVTGVCTSCETGWTGEKCSECQDLNKYGERCDQTCSVHCRASQNITKRCHTVTGVCTTSCEMGWTGPRCDTLRPFVTGNFLSQITRNINSLNVNFQKDKFTIQGTTSLIKSVILQYKPRARDREWRSAGESIYWAKVTSLVWNITGLQPRTSYLLRVILVDGDTWDGHVLNGTTQVEVTTLCQPVEKAKIKLLQVNETTLNILFVESTPQGENYGACDAEDYTMRISNLILNNTEFPVKQHRLKSFNDIVKIANDKNITCIPLDQNYEFQITILNETYNLTMEMEPNNFQVADIDEKIWQYTTFGLAGCLLLVIVIFSVILCVVVKKLKSRRAEEMELSFSDVWEARQKKMATGESSMVEERGEYKMASGGNKMTGKQKKMLKKGNKMVASGNTSVLEDEGEDFIYDQIIPQPLYGNY